MPCRVSDNTHIVVNARNIHNKETTGVQRYTQEIISRSHRILNPVTPPAWADSTAGGYFWEQISLPVKLKTLLWSPANVGPILYRNQVVTVHDLSVFDHPEWFDRKYVLIYHLLLPQLLKRVKHILTDSEYSRQRIIERFGLPPSKVTAIPLAAAEQFKPFPDEEIAQDRAKQGWPKRFLLSVGSLEPRKNLGCLLRAWEIWPNRPEDLRLLVVGAGGRVFSGLGFDRVPDGVHLLGRVDDADLPGLYAAAEALVYPSLYEGFGLPPLEAMACGTPVITSNTTSLPEVVGDAALLVNPYLEVSLLQAMQQVTEWPQLRAELSARGLERSKLFSWERTAAETEQLLMQQAE
jgi:glycosyltransferase involved in cell wall biosynthesis